MGLTQCFRRHWYGSNFFKYTYFGVRFTPHGNERKFLDIRVRFIPLAHPRGQCCWYAWKGHPSKVAYIEDYNAMLDKMGIGTVVDLEKVGLNKLNPKDHDLYV